MKTLKSIIAVAALSVSINPAWADDEGKHYVSMSPRTQIEYVFKKHCIEGYKFVITVGYKHMDLTQIFGINDKGDMSPINCEDEYSFQK